MRSFHNIMLHVFVVYSSFITLTTSYKVHLSPSWYPSKKADLLDVLSNYEQQAQKLYDAHLDSAKIRALIVPHAGYEYSGIIASSAYRLLPSKYFKRVIILAPSHYESFQGVGLPSNDYRSYRNILGEIPLDLRTIGAFASDSRLVTYKSHAHQVDHAINVQLPFIQRYCGKQCQIVPLLVGDITTEQAEKLAEFLMRYIDERTLVVVSSDFTHYGNRFSYEPFKNNITQSIYGLDSRIVHEIQNESLQGFDAVLQDTGATVCGKNALKLFLALVQKKAFGDVDTYVVGYDTSASAEVNPDHSVSYVSCVISNELIQDLSLQDRFTEYEKRMLLTLARKQLDSVVSDVSIVKYDVAVPGLLTNALREIRGAFVTLYKIGRDGYKQLRGCVGKVDGTQPLYQTVYDMAASAALHDNRFSPVTKQELPYIDLSISVLTQPKAIQSYRYIELGRDGVMLHYNNHSAVYLPKVANEQGWTLEQMLESLCQKAGLPKDSWRKSDMHYKTFESIDFAEDKDPLEIMYEGYKK